jgi:hypothetical protein
MKSEPTSKTTYSTKYFATVKKPFSVFVPEGEAKYEVGRKFELSNKYSAYRAYEFSKRGVKVPTCYMQGEWFGWEYFTVTAEETARTVTTQTESKEVTPTEYWEFR